MTDLTIPGIPASITRTQYTEAIKQLGIDPEQLVEMRWGWNTITAVVYALNEDGKRYVDEQKMEAAVHEICIRIDDGTPCPCSYPEGWDACPVHPHGTPTPPPDTPAPTK